MKKSLTKKTQPRSWPICPPGKGRPRPRPRMRIPPKEQEENRLARSLRLLFRLRHQKEFRPESSFFSFFAIPPPWRVQKLQYFSYVAILHWKSLSDFHFFSAHLLNCQFPFGPPAVPKNIEVTLRKERNSTREPIRTPRGGRAERKTKLNRIYIFGEGILTIHFDPDLCSGARVQQMILVLADGVIGAVPSLLWRCNWGLTKRFSRGINARSFISLWRISFSGQNSHRAG